MKFGSLGVGIELNRNPEPLNLEAAIGEGRTDWVLQKLTNSHERKENMLLNKSIIFDKLSLRTKGEKVEDKLSVRPFQYAILAHQTSMVQMMLDFASEKDTTLLKRMITMTTNVEFRGQLKLYFKDDISLNGINAIHLATKFHIKSLILIIQCLYKKRLMGKYVL